jgi:hypothetical protein
MKGPGFDAAVNDFKRNLLAGLNINAAIVNGQAVRDAPVDTGDLRGSGHVEEAKEFGPDGKATARIVFNKPYAAVQHEDQTFKHPRGGKAKYLEAPLKAHNWTAGIGGVVRARMGGPM